LFSYQPNFLLPKHQKKTEVQQVITRFFDALSVTNIPQMKAEVSDDFMLLENWRNMDD